MTAELPPAKNASEYTLEERKALTRDAAAAALLLAAHLARLVELEEEIRRREQ
jgi:hypothetical protein